MAISITWADVVLIAPELSTVPTGAQNAILADVDLQVNEDVLESKYNLAAKYLCAHLATIRARAGAGGPVTSVSVGAVSKSYGASIADGAAQLGSTGYGLEYERIINTCAMARLASDCD